MYLIFNENYQYLKYWLYKEDTGLCRNELIGDSSTSADTVTRSRNWFWRFMNAYRNLDFSPFSHKRTASHGVPRERERERERFANDGSDSLIHATWITGNTFDTVVQRVSCIRVSSTEILSCMNKAIVGSGGSRISGKGERGGEWPKATRGWGVLEIAHFSVFWVTILLMQISCL